MGSKLVWAMRNFIVFACMVSTAVISLISDRGIECAVGGDEAIKNASLVVFAVLGLPLAIIYSVPFSVTAELTTDTGGGGVIRCRIGNWTSKSCNCYNSGAVINAIGAIVLGALVGTQYVTLGLIGASVYGSSWVDWHRIFAHTKPISSVDYMICLPAHGAVIGARFGAWPMPLHLGKDMAG